VYNHGSTIVSMSAVWNNRASLSPWLDRFINVDRVDPYCNHGSTASSMSAVWIRIATMARPPLQSRLCGTYAIYHNHGSNVNVVHVELKVSIYKPIA
jgi:hypothetical protein